MIKVLFYFVIGVISVYYEILWLIFTTYALEILLSNWNRWRHISPISPEQSMFGLIALFKIRSAEIGAMYQSIRNHQNKAKEKPWIPSFIAEYRSSFSYCIYQESCNKSEGKYRNRAQALYSKRFNYDHFYGLLNEQALMDIGVAMLYSTSNLQSTIRLLKSIKCDFTLSKHVCALIREYRLIRLLTLDGNYHILFKNWRPISSLVRERYLLLTLHWSEICRSLKYLILTAQASGELEQASVVLESIWIECEVLAEMERNLRRTLSQENAESIFWDLNRKNEEIFNQNLKSNPIWLKLYGNEP